MTQARGAGAPDVAVSRDGLPDWLTPVADAAEVVRPEQLSRFLPPAAGGLEFSLARGQLPSPHRSGTRSRPRCATG